ncbi:MAG: polyprenyl synthetase family protein [Neptuniibacter sp.]
MSDFKEFFSYSKQTTDDLLEERFPKNLTPKVIEETYDAMRYMLFLGDGGKRIRPAMTFLGCKLFGGNQQNCYEYAISIELIHTYTLILDDIQDKSNLRRGEPSCHTKYGFNTAILAGMQLFEKGLAAFHRIDGVQGEIFSQLMEKLHRGQSADLNSETWDTELNTLKNLQFIHAGKTSALFQTALLGGAVSANASMDEIDDVINYGHYLGLAFQARDDVLGIISSDEILGKPTGEDADGSKLTYPNLFQGAELAQREAEQLAEKAITFIAKYGEPSKMLIDLARYSVLREK